MAYLGQVAVVGVVAAVKAGQGFTIVDQREYADCGLSCVNEPETRKIPVRYLTSAPQKDWADNFSPPVSFWQSYIVSQDYFVSFSYALSASFAVWAP